MKWENFVNNKLFKKINNKIRVEIFSIKKANYF